MKLLRAVREGTPIQSYQNLFVNYTTNAHIAQWIAYLLERDLRGVFHIGTRDMREYAAFQRELLQALGLQPPAFHMERWSEPQYQAVLPGRTDIPSCLQFDVADVLAYLVENRPAVGEGDKIQTCGMDGFGGPPGNGKHAPTKEGGAI